MNDTSIAAVDDIDSAGVNPALWQLKREAEAEVRRLRTEYERASPGQTRGRLRNQLDKAERRLALEISSIREAALPEALREGHSPNVNRELAELLEAGMRVLIDYTDKLDRLVNSALTIWDRRENVGNQHTKDIAVAVQRDLDPFLRAALDRCGAEFVGLEEPLRQWITKLSATLEEGRLTEVQRMELRLRLTDLEVKFQTAGRLLTAR